MFFKILQTALKEKEPMYLSKAVPFARCENDLLLTYNSNAVGVVEILGKDFSSLSNEQKEILFENVKSLLNSFSSDLSLSIVIRKERFASSLTNANTSLEERINQTHSEQFKESYSHSYFLVVSSSAPSNLSSTILKGSLKNSLNKNKELVRNTLAKILNFLNQFQPSVLKNTRLLEFYFYEINAHNKTLKFQKDDINDLLSASDINFTPTLTYNDNLFSAFVSIVAFENESDTDEFLKELLSLKAVFSIYQIFNKLGIKQTADFIKRREKYLENFHDSIGDDEFIIIKDSILKANESLFKYGLFVQIYENTKERLELKAQEVYALCERYGYTPKIEKDNSCLYHARLCEYEDYMVRKRVKVASNIASLNSFEKTKNGFKTCSFGAKQTATFFNTFGNHYNFIFHESPKPQALGNTLLMHK